MKKVLTSVEPAWVAVRTARKALHLSDFMLLHAGPPLKDPGQMCTPLRNSCLLSCIYEGWANHEAEAWKLIIDGHVKLEPAQKYGAVTPLAAVISPNSTLVEVADLATASSSSVRAWSLLSSGTGPQLRFGTGDRSILARMVWRDGALAKVLAACLNDRAIPLWPLAEAGLRGGDDLHSRTTEAQVKLNEILLARLHDGVFTGSDSQKYSVTAMLTSSPLFFLTLWMAVCHLLLTTVASVSAPDSTIVVGMAGNGEQVGIRLAGQPDEWFVARGCAPKGIRLDHCADLIATPFIGDSGVIDAMGFGGQALGCAPEAELVLKPWLPRDWCLRPARLLKERNPRLEGLGLYTGLDAAAVASSGLEPLVTVAMIDSTGSRGLLGRGVYMPPVELFLRAVAAVRKNYPSIL